MMSFKLAFNSMRKNMKDYIIYFLTLILGVAIFYIFNSMDSQQAMIAMSDSKRQMIELMVELLSGVSVFVSLVLGFLIVYANNFLIKRRKKEFGLYMLLGMGKKQINTVLLMETMLVGIFSLIIGLMIGIFGAQLMSVLVANLFEANMTEYQFVFSQDAFIKTIVYFVIIYVVVMLVNLLTTSRYKLIDLLTAGKKNEKVKLRNPVISVILCLVSIVTLGIAYYIAITKITSMNLQDIMLAIVLGCLGTFLFFYSLSGFLLKLIQSRKKMYFKNLNMFVLRQVNSQINTTTFSMSIISVLLFLTICIFSSAVSINNSITKQLELCNPVDITMTKKMDKMATQYSTEKGDNNAKKTIQQLLSELDFEVKDNFSNFVEVSIYQTSQITLKETLGEEYENELKMAFMNAQLDSKEKLIKLSDYNKIASLYGRQTLSLQENEYAILGDADEMLNYRNKALAKGKTIEINGKSYKPKYQSCIEGSIINAPQPMEIGTIILPDSAIPENWRNGNILSANYQASTPEEKQKIEDKIGHISDKIAGSINEYNFLDWNTKMIMYDSSKGISTIVTFIGLYLGIIFLISSSAILALKQLSESSDNQERYNILRKIGTDEKMISKALFKQIAIFYFMPLGLAIIHSIFGMITAQQILVMFGKQDLITSIIITAIFIIAIYGGYFVATYVGSKNIIKSDKSH